MSRILIADNSNDVLEVMELLLEMYGHEVKTATNKEFLFSQLRLYNPNLIILDTFLEAKNGKEICKEIKSDESSKYSYYFNVDK